LIREGFKPFDGSIIICIDPSAFMLLDFHAKARDRGGWGRENQAAQAV